MKSRSNSGEHYYSKRPKSKPRIGLIRTHLRGRLFEFLTTSSVFSHKRIDLGTRLLIESMILPKEGYILDLGCGYGAVGIAAAVFNPDLHVVMVDVNERAVRTTKENAKRHRVANTDIRQGFLYEPVEGMRFDAILSNPPLSAGLRIVKHIILGAGKLLDEDGLFQLVVRSKIGGRQCAKELEAAYGNVEVLARKSGYRVLLSKKP